MLFQIQKELIQQKKPNILKSIEHDISEYKKLKKSYIKLSESAQKRLVPQFLIFLLLVSIIHNDMDFAVQLVYRHDYVKFNTQGANLALGRFFNKLGLCIEVIKYFLPIFDEGKLESADLNILFKSLFERARHKDCQLVIEHVLQNYPNNFGWDVAVLDYKLKINHLYPTSRDQIAEKLKLLYPRCVTTEEYYQLGDCFYAAGYFQDALNMLNIALQKLVSTPTIDYKALFDSSKCLESMNLVIDVLERHNIKPFPIAGSLLGLVRDGKFMDHDKDTDIGIFVSNYDEIFNIVSKVCNEPRFISSAMINCSKESHFWNIALLDAINSTTIDLFFFYRHPTHSEFGLYTTCGILKWTFKPFRLTRQILVGKEYWLPENIEEHLVQMYGDSWREPIESWDSLLNCPNLTPDSQSVAVFYGLMRLHNSLYYGKIKKALNYYQQLTTRWGMRFSPEADMNIQKLLSENAQ
jgi:hypothetical protein